MNDERCSWKMCIVQGSITSFTVHGSFEISNLRREARLKNRSIQQAFTRALDALVEQIKGDRSILAAILCGSLSYDTVWARSDIDLVLVAIDDKKLQLADLSLYSDGVNI